MFQLHDNIVEMDRKGVDRKIFFGEEGEKQKFVFRIEEKEKDKAQLMSLLHGPWKQLFYQMFHDN